ncbi:MAG: FAD-dependent oxidoreductase [Candidatus Aenigmarchaeota archaeon]|nr:FAD-dependent oxidoreductase [Candidatus Aenigmarchaeota archaeon]
MPKKMKEAKGSEMYDLIIIGGGCAGLAAAMYSARLEMKTLLLADNMGGTITLTDLVENYPGFIRLTGQELADKLKEHALDYKQNLQLKEERADEIKKLGKEGCFEVKTGEGTYSSKTILFATGTMWRELKVPGHDKFKNKGVQYCALCLPPDESIITNSAIREIKDVTPVTNVLTLEGRFKPVGGFTNINHSGKLVKIKTRMFREPVLLTPNHPVYATNVIKGQGINYWKDFKFTEPEWVEAGKLKEGRLVLYPVPKEVENRDFIKLSDFIEADIEENNIIPKRSTHTTRPVPDKIKIDGNFLRLVGYFLSEGSSYKHTLNFYFNSKELEYTKDVESLLGTIFGLEVHSQITGRVQRTLVYSRIVARFFKQELGSHAHNKSIPHWMMILPPEKQKDLIKGTWRGDGCVREKDFCYVTSSRQLAYQMRDLLLRQGILPSIEKRNRSVLNKNVPVIEGRKVHFNHDKYHVYVSGPYLEKMSGILDTSHPYAKKRRNVMNYAWLKDGFAILPIKSVEFVDYEGPVIDIGVPESNTFVAKNFIVHNCDGALFRNKVVAVVGGSDSAAKEALVLTRYCPKVYIIYRGDQIHPEPPNMVRVQNEIKKGKIEIINHTNVTEIRGDKFVTSVVLDKPYKGKKELPLQGVFVSIGHLPLSDLAKKLGVKTNEENEIIIDRNSATNVPGVYAAGDVCDTQFKQAIVGVGEAVSAVYSAYKYIGDHPEIICV